MKQWAGDLAARFSQRLPRTAHVLQESLAATLRDGYIHAGNLAYLSIVTLFPLLISFTAVTVALGQTDMGREGIEALIYALPPDVASTFRPIVDEVLQARTGNMLWVGGLVALWTVTGFVETLRDIIHRAYDVDLKRGYFTYRLYSVLGTLVAMLMLLVTLSLHVLVTLPLETITSRLSFLPGISSVMGYVDWTRAFIPISVFIALWLLFRVLTPSSFRALAVWPGALLTTVVWAGCVWLLGPFVSTFSQMNLTYGALSGVMLAMIFFYVVGFALVLGAELNAALAKLDRPE